MGTWGLKVEQSDSYSDVYDCFYESYNDGESPEAASGITKESCSEYFEDYEDSNSAWFALAYAQWETKCLESDVLEKVQEIISSGADVRLWQELGGSESDLKKRNVYLQKFLAKISTPRATQKCRKKKKIDFRNEKLVEIVAPDNKKVFTVTEEYRNDEYIHTVALMMWSSGGGSVFFHEKQGVKVEAKWLDSNDLEITTEKGFIFGKQDESAFFCGDKVTVTYKYW